MRFDPESIKQAYSEPPGAYAGLPPPGTLRRYKQQAVERLGRRFCDIDPLRDEAYASCKLDAHSSVLLLCCGTVVDAGRIAKYSGPQARIVGIDFSRAMLDRGRAFVDALGMPNVELREGDVTADLSLGNTQFDLTCCGFGFSIIPHWERAYDNLVKHTKVGGQILVIDTRNADGWRSVLNPVFTWILKPYGATSEGHRNFKRVVDRMTRDLTDVKTELKHFAGFARGTRRS